MYHGAHFPWYKIGAKGVNEAVLEADFHGVYLCPRLKCREKLLKTRLNSLLTEASWRGCCSLLSPECCSIQISILSLLTFWPAEIIMNFYSWLGWDEASCQAKSICKGVKSWKLCQLFINGRQFTECCQNLRASVSLQASVPSCATVRNMSNNAYFMSNLFLSFNWKISKTQDGEFSNY